MITEHIAITRFEQDASFYGRIELLLTVKSFELDKIRERYLQSRHSGSGRRGSANRREAGIGGVAHVVIEQGKLVHCEVLAKLKEPRGIAAACDRLAISAENEVFVLGDAVQTLRNPWFSYIHTLDFSADNRLLVSSSGFDALFEYDLATGAPTMEWFAWEHGFNRGKDPETGAPVLLTRVPLEDPSQRHLLINDPATQVLPTAMRAAFINSVVYDAAAPDTLLATFFHEGAVYAIDRKSGAATQVLGELTTPHGGRRWGDAVLATSTGSGEVVVGGEGRQQRYQFRQLPGKPDFLEDMEWLQNSTVLGEHIITIDSNRTSFVIFDPKKGVRDVIPYPSNWAVQDLVVGALRPEQEAAVRGLDQG